MSEVSAAGDAHRQQVEQDAELRKHIEEQCRQGKIVKEIAENYGLDGDRIAELVIAHNFAFGRQAAMTQMAQPIDLSQLKR